MARIPEIMSKNDVDVGVTTLEKAYYALVSHNLESFLIIL